MQILHISTECYPAAKAGGLGDVVGALPKYLNNAGMSTAVIIPKYKTKWLMKQKYREVHRETVRLHVDRIDFAVEVVVDVDLGYDLYVVDIPGKFDRPGVYLDENGRAYEDELERYICFQQAVLTWVRNFEVKPKVLHCHDHHTGLIPFFVKHSPEFKMLANIPTVFTIHNGAYHGSFSWNNLHLLPYIDSEASGLLEWQGAINPLATGIKCSWAFTTVSPGYLEELRENSNGLEDLINSEMGKAQGILNGIDNNVWDPKTDKYLQHHLKTSADKFKDTNRAEILKHFHLSPELPIVTFIGRLAREKGADILPNLIKTAIHSGIQANFLILGTGDPHLHNVFHHLKTEYRGRFDAALEYNEGLARLLYAGSDFLLMPSRVEPCGLNQMYACRYGTLPIVRSIGGLKDSIPDIGEAHGQGRGIRFDYFTLEDAMLAVYRATEVYRDKKALKAIRKRIMAVDFSWENSAGAYMEIYNRVMS
jgi:starch synthase